MVLELITIGDEVLLGSVLDSNAHWIARRLTDAGMRLTYHQTIGDNPQDVLAAFAAAAARSTHIFVTGGLGPTHDDITAEMVARFFDDRLEERAELREMIEGKFRARGVKPSPNYEKMARFPSGATPILNEQGAAPGIHYTHGDLHLFSMPGVPREMKGMFDDYVLPFLKSGATDIYRSIHFQTAGPGETILAQKIGSPDRFLPATLAFLPSIDHGVTVRVSTRGNNEEIVTDTLNKVGKQITDAIGNYIYCVGEKSLETVIIETMRERGLKLALAESCTGGLLSGRIVAVPGCSDVFERGFVTYSNEAKQELLHVPEEIIRKHGAVSAECATAMADGARRHSRGDVAVSVTGIAGPTGGTEEKPVGLVYIGLSWGNISTAQRYRFAGDRDSIRGRSAFAALTELWTVLQNG